MSNIIHNIGCRLRLIRNDKGLSLNDLSQISSVSKAMLSQIEKNKVNPTVAVILKIAEALNVGLGDLVDAPGPRNILRVIPDTDKHYNFRTDAACTIRTLSPLNLEKDLEFYRLMLESLAELRSEPHFPGAMEILFVAKGRLIVTSGKETVTLGRGDSLYYRADVFHSIKNVSRSRAELYLIVHNQASRAPGHQLRDPGKATEEFPAR